MFKYLMLWVSLMLALPSSAAAFYGGNWSAGGTSTTTTYTEVNATAAAADMRIQAMGIRLNAGVDNPLLTGFSSSQPFKYFDYLGFTSLPSGGRNQLATVTMKPALTPWGNSGYFEIGNGLAMKLMVGDDRSSSLQILTQASPIITHQANPQQPLREKVGIEVQAKLKVIGNVDPSIVVNVDVATFEYRVWRVGPLGNEWGKTIHATIKLNINVLEAALKTCTLAPANQNREYFLSEAIKPNLDAGFEVPGGEIITIGPVVCPDGVDVKASFFDHNSPSGSGPKNYLRTKYIDDNTLSQYALKLSPVGGGNPLQFLPLEQLSGGWNAVANATTIDFANNTTANIPIQKDYTVKYIKTTEIGDDRPGHIQGLMTVQFLYY